MNRWLSILLLCAAPVWGGAGVDFDRSGTNEWLCGPHQSWLDGATVLTMSIWFKLGVETSSAGMNFASAWGTNTSGKQYQFYWQDWGTEVVQLRLYDDTNQSDCYYAYSFGTADWHNVTVTWNVSGTTNNGCQWYHNGVAVTTVGSGTDITTDVSDSNMELSIGCAHNNTDNCGGGAFNPFGGTLAHLQMWSQELTAAEVAQATFCPGSIPELLEVWYPLMDGNSGTAPTQYDISGSGGSASVAGTPTVSSDGPPISICGGQN